MIVCLGIPEVSKETFHPELEENEVFLTNIYLTELYLPRRRRFTAIQYKTKRLGRVAYDQYGEVISGMVPVFVKKWEIERKNS